MDNAQTAAPAGDSAQPVSDNQALSLDDAVALLGPDEPEKKNPAPSKPSEAPAETEAEEEPAGEAEPATEEVEEQPDAEAPEPEPETEPESEYAHGNLKVRLRDGTELTVADLKKGRERVQELERQVGETEARVRKELEPTLTQAQQKQKALDELLPIAVQAMQAQIPPLPDPSLRETDPLEYHNRKDMHLEAVARLRDLQVAQVKQAQERQQAESEAVQTYLKEQQTELLKVRPDLKEPAKAQAFYATFLEAAKSLGVSQEQADTVHDHRIVLGIVQLHEKAKKWDALQKAKPPVVAEKEKGAAPVAAPARRASPGERRNAQVEDLDKKLSRTGSLDDAVALLELLKT